MKNIVLTTLLATLPGPTLASNNYVRRQGLQELDVSDTATFNMLHQEGSKHRSHGRMSFQVEVSGDILTEEWESPHPLPRDLPPRRRHDNTSASALQGAQGEGSSVNCATKCEKVTSCSALKAVLQKYTIRPVSEVPSAYQIQTTYSGFYTKYINVLGIPVLSSDKVCDCVLQKAAWIAHGTLSHLKRWHEVTRKMKEKKSRLSIMADSEVTTDIPEHSSLQRDFPGTDWNARCRGIGATPSVPASSGAEENIMCAPPSADGYFGENILLHEFVHGIARTGLVYLTWNGGESWDTYNGDLFQAATRKQLWWNTYAGSNKVEYFAEGVQMWFDAQSQPSCCRGGCDPGNMDCCHDTIHNCADTRDKLKRYDPHLYNRLNTLLHRDGWTPGKGDSCGCGQDNYEEGFVELSANGDAQASGEVLEAPRDECRGKSQTVCKGKEPECLWASSFDCKKDCTFFTTKVACGEDAFCQWSGSFASGSCNFHCTFILSQSDCQQDAMCAWSSGKCGVKPTETVQPTDTDQPTDTGRRRRRTRRRRAQPTATGTAGGTDNTKKKKGDEDSYTDLDYWKNLAGVKSGAYHKSISLLTLWCLPALALSCSV